jgi:pyruvate, orthophosphate dikinase
MARAWEGTSARLLRQAKGAPDEAGLGLVVQEMAQGIGQGISGSGVIQFVDPVTGLPQITGRYLGQSQGRDALKTTEALYLTRDPRGPSLEEVAPEIFATLVEYGCHLPRPLREEMQIEFTIEDGRLAVLDAIKVRGRSRAGPADRSGAGRGWHHPNRNEAVLRVEPQALSELLHHQVDPRGARDRDRKGIAASPGAATGRLVFSSERRAGERGTGRGLHSGAARNGTRGYPRHAFRGGCADRTRRHDQPCGGDRARAGPSLRGRCVRHAAGRARQEAGHHGGWPRVPRRRRDNAGRHQGRGAGRGGRDAATGAGRQFPPLAVNWADAVRDIGVRANADTPADAETARKFEAQGIGLCRTEHMFFDEDRLVVMREMIFADTPTDRAAALARLLPMQRADFVQLFEIMQGLPVCIRLCSTRPCTNSCRRTAKGLRDLAEALDRPLSEVTRRAEALTEVNPMLGMRGVRLGVVLPEIYDMQAQAIFEATLESRPARGRRGARNHDPLVSARREVELVKTRIDAVAAMVRTAGGGSLSTTSWA